VGANATERFQRPIEGAEKKCSKAFLISLDVVLREGRDEATGAEEGTNVELGQNRLWKKGKNSAIFLNFEG